TAHLGPRAAGGLDAGGEIWTGFGGRRSWEILDDGGFWPAVMLRADPGVVAGRESRDVERAGLRFPGSHRRARTNGNASRSDDEGAGHELHDASDGDVGFRAG